MIKKSTDWLQELSRFCIEATAVHGSDTAKVISDVDERLASLPARKRLEMQSNIRALIAEGAGRGKPD